MVIDILFVLIVILAIIHGYRKGFIIALFSLAAWVLGLAAALKLSAVAAKYFQVHEQLHSRWIPVLCFVLLFIGVILLVRLLGKLLEKVVRLALLGWLNRLAGILFFLLIYSIVFSILLWLANQLQLIPASVRASSLVYRHIAFLGPWAIDMTGSLIPLFRNIFRDLEQFFGNLSAGKT